MRQAVCAIALGSNLGDSAAILTGALAHLQSLPQVQLIAASAHYRTAPVGPPQPDYLNQCALLKTSLAPETLLQVLLDTEAQFGRVRRERWGPRLLDIDLLLVEQQVLNTTTLSLPHPRMHERAFVLVPLAEIAPDWPHPVLGQTIAQLKATVNTCGVEPCTVPSP